jgi:hypothetical protein
VLTRSHQGTPLILYLAVSDSALSSALVQEAEGEEKPVYFVSKTLSGAELRYQKLEKLSLAIIVTARRLRSIFRATR